MYRISVGDPDDPNTRTGFPMNRNAGVLILIMALSSIFPISAKAQVYPRDYSDPGYWLSLIEEWRKAVEQHKPGEPDSGAIGIADWSPFELEFSIALFKNLIRRPVYELSIPPWGCRSLADYLGIKKEEDKNYWLKRGALLHADIALLGLETGSANMGQGQLSFMKKWIKTSKRDQAKTCWSIRLLTPAILDLKDKSDREMAWLHDGVLDYESQGRHMEFGRFLLDSVTPSPSQDEMTREWYIATAAYGLSRGRPGYIYQHLDNAVKLFPFDAQILLFAGSLHETYATPRYQNVPRLRGIKYSHGTKKSELELARNLFQRAVLANPDFAEARLHLGHVLGLLDYHTKAVSELQKAAASIRDSELQYFNALFLGNELASLRRIEEARIQFQQAAELYPDAQTPLISLSQLAHSDGDIQNASLVIERAFAVADSSPRGNDPRWKYDLVPDEKAATLLLRMRKSFGELSR